MALGFTISKISDDLEAAFYAARSIASPSAFNSIATIATNTMKEAGALLKKGGRDNIAAAGFSSKWQNTWRVDIYPKRGVSIDAAAFAYHKIPYASIFETGGTIHAKAGLLWIALPTVPKVGKARGTPKTLAARGVKLFTIARAGKAPLLATNIRLSKAQANNLKNTVKGRKSLLGRLSLSRLSNSPKRGVNATVPLFFGVNSVTIRKKFNLEGVAVSVQDQLAALYEKNAQAE